LVADAPTTDAPTMTDLMHPRRLPTTAHRMTVDVRDPKARVPNPTASDRKNRDEFTTRC